MCEKVYTLRLTDKALEDVMKVLDRFVIEDSYGDAEGRENAGDAYEQLGEQKTAHDMGLFPTV